MESKEKLFLAQQPQYPADLLPLRWEVLHSNRLEALWPYDAIRDHDSRAVLHADRGACGDGIATYCRRY